MEEFKGTKGKWYFANRMQNNDSGMYSVEVFCDKGETIANIAWYPKPKEKKVIDGEIKIVTGTYREANALLISKSPEMLALLQRMVDENMLSHKGDDLAKQLIKEALGNEPI